MKNTGSFIIGLLSGAAIGAALGILYAPDKGENTREKLNQRANDLREDLDERFDDMKDYMNETVGDIKERMNEMKDKFADVKGKVKKEA